MTLTAATTSIVYGDSTSLSGRFVWVQRQGLYGWTNTKRVYLGTTSRAT